MDIDLDFIENNLNFFEFYLKKLIQFKIKQKQFFLLEKSNNDIKNSKDFFALQKNWHILESNYEKTIQSREQTTTKIDKLKKNLEFQKLLCFEENFSESEINVCISTEKENYYSNLKNIYFGL